MMNTDKKYQRAPRERKSYEEKPRTQYEGHDNRYEKIPYNAIERCYVTEYIKEMMYLNERGFRPVRSTIRKEWGIRQYKYVKTPELFAALHEFWVQEAGERVFYHVDRDIERATKSEH